MGGAPRGGGTDRPVPTEICLPGPPGGQRQEVEVAIRNLQLCLDPGLPGRNPARPTGATCPLTSQEKCPALPRARRAFLGLPWGTELREAPGHGDAHPAHPRVLEPPAPHACPSWVTVPGAFSFSKDSVGFFLRFCFCSAEGPWTLRLPSVGANSYSLRCQRNSKRYFEIYRGGRPESSACRSPSFPGPLDSPFFH